MSEISSLHKAIARVLNWPEAEVTRMNLATLRELVRPLSPKLYAEIASVIQEGRHIVGTPNKKAGT